LQEASEQIATAKTEAGLAKEQIEGGINALKQIVFDPLLIERQAEIEALREEMEIADSLQTSDTRQRSSRAD
jgi:hypothetical protein